MPEQVNGTSVSTAQLRSALEVISGNYSWVWDQGGKSILTRALGLDWKGCTHPYAALTATSDGELSALSKDNEFAMAVLAQADQVKTLETWSDGPERHTPDIAYFSPEFGISETLPQYSGGLGILAGDHLKAASDVGLSLVGVGLFYANGYFDQGLTANKQSVSYQTYEPADLGLTDTGLTIEVETPKGLIRASVWLAKVGRIRLYVMDTRVAGNNAWASNVTDRLYGGDQAHRVDQEWLLGIGGLRALAALGIEPTTVHLNEGHAGFLILELITRQLDGGSTLSEAQAWVRQRTLFTTHTPVPAGIDRFPADLLKPYINEWAATAKAAEAVWKSGELPNETEGDLFNMAAFCLRHAGRSNGVSALHGTVSQDLFGSLEEGAAITSVTNGVHARTWLAPAVQDLLELHVGPDFSVADEQGWQAASQITDVEISSLRTGLRSELVSYLADEHGLTGLDPNVLTIGFARRFATYKRAALLLKERDALIKMLNNDEYPVQFVFAGKAHPADTDGQRVFQEIAEFGASPEANGRFVLVPGYDISVASYLYGGCDVWLNNPVRPQEACGTSGEKSALNGGLNCSILDGWWAEWYHAENGWAIQTSDLADPKKRDAAEAKGLIKLLGEAVIPLFYDNASAWNQRIRFGWQYLGPRVTAARMVKDYDQLLYRPLYSPLRTPH